MNLNNTNFDVFYRQWVLLSSITYFIGISLAFSTGNLCFLVVFVSLLFGIYLIKIIYHLPSLPLIYGYANWVSIIRFLCILITFYLHPYLKNNYLLIIFTFSILLDGVDGFLARKFRHETHQGAILDMEIDALLVLLLAYIHISNNRITQWILIPASFRYIYAWILLFQPFNNAKEKVPKFVRATIAVIFFLALLTPFTNMSIKLSHIIVNISGVLIMLSFGVSYYFDFQQMRTGK